VDFLLTRLSRRSLEHVARTTVAATFSLALAEAFRFREAYWAAITTMIVMQSTLGAALTVSTQRFVGTALGAAAGALLVTRLGSNLVVFAAGVCGLGIVCAILNLDRAAYRFAGIALAIMILVPRNDVPWMIAMHRLFEVSLGIATALLITELWPERPAPPSGQSSTAPAP
jgi:uncharacterized membrane protein YccC